MIIPLDKLLTYGENKYIFTRSTMEAFSKVDNIEDYPEEEKSWKLVPNVLALMLNEDIKFTYHGKTTGDPDII